MSADCSPVCGRASTMLSIFTTSTGPSAETGSPVNGESTGRLADGLADGGTGADDPVSATMSPMASASTAAAADKLIAIVRWLLVIGPLPDSMIGGGAPPRQSHQPSCERTFCSARPARLRVFLACRLPSLLLAMLVAPQTRQPHLLTRGAWCAWRDAGAC